MSLHLCRGPVFVNPWMYLKDLISSAFAKKSSWRFQQHLVFFYRKTTESKIHQSLLYFFKSALNPDVWFAPRAACRQRADELPSHTAVLALAWCFLTHIPLLQHHVLQVFMKWFFLQITMTDIVEFEDLNQKLIPAAAHPDWRSGRRSRYFFTELES